MGESSARIEEWCFAWLPASGKSRGVALQEALWDSGEIIRVRFLDGGSTEQDLVRQHAVEWIERSHANLSMRFVSAEQAADVRVSFSAPGNWSAIGTSCRAITDSQQATLNLGSIGRRLSATSARQFILHEFGHALGLVHEHQSPTNPIAWDHQRVRTELSGAPNYWNEATIAANVFDARSSAESNFTEFDPDSIMMYPIPDSWTTDGTTFEWQTELSDGDIQFLRELYP